MLSRIVCTLGLLQVAHCIIGESRTSFASCEEMRSSHTSNNCCAQREFQPPRADNMLCPCGLGTELVDADVYGDAWVVLEYHNITEALYESYKAWVKSPQGEPMYRKLITGAISGRSADGTRLTTVQRYPYAAVNDENFLNKLLSLGTPIGSKMVHAQWIFPPRLLEEPAVQTWLAQSTQILPVALPGLTSRIYNTTNVFTSPAGFSGDGTVLVLRGINTKSGTVRGKYDDATKLWLHTYMRAQMAIQGSEHDGPGELQIIFHPFNKDYDDAALAEYRSNLLTEVFGNFPEYVPPGAMHAIDINGNPNNYNEVQNALLAAGAFEFRTTDSHPPYFA